MIVAKAKANNNFRVHFEKFGTGDSATHLSAQVLRVTRPGAAVCDLLGLTETQPISIEIDLRDDISDATRAEVMTQIAKQIRDEAEFAMVIETLGTSKDVQEQWYLSGCQITYCQCSELTLSEGMGLMIRLTIASRRIATTAFGQLLELFS